MQHTYADIDAYIAAFPSNIQTILKKIRRTIQKAAPRAEEKIAYGMPTFTLNGNLVHFAAFTYHIGFYPTPSAIKKFEKELSLYKTSKGAIQFPIEKPIPYDLIEKIVAFRVTEQKK
ncbi:MAG: hypothetical protein HGB03_03020 [Candidatus Yonathbacteria bacterium]|nr:hypothetical protein [Candidatus Yonathbacteria bacterium]NTW47394.1 hypothetical protein [Candidatus Yonathbacteria bacterium]